MLKTFLNLLRLTPQLTKYTSPQPQPQEPDNLQVDWDRQKEENRAFWLRAYVNIHGTMPPDSGF